VRGQEGTNFQNLTFSVNNVIFEMVFVEGGTFVMGCTPEQGNDCLEREKPAHKVTVGNFYIGKYPITQAQWKAVMEYYPIELHNTGCDSCPVERVSWEDAQEFITKLKALTNKIYRLPTEAEWEFAARGGNKSRGYRYAGSNTLEDVITNFQDANWDMDYIPGLRMPNELGIHDMSSQASEWVLGHWKDYGELEPAHNPGRITLFDFTQPFYHIQKGGNMFLETMGVNNEEGFVSGSPFRPEARIRIQPHAERNSDDFIMRLASVRFVRNAGLEMLKEEQASNE
jgi:formylglycine-generating enzyme required for sulfatase activity